MSLFVPWTERIRNIEILSRLNKKIEILDTIKKRKLENYDHVMRGGKYGLLQNIIQGHGTLEKDAEFNKFTNSEGTTSEPSFHICLAVLLVQAASTLTYNSTKNARPKAKRTLSDQIYNHGETKPVVFFMDNTNPSLPQHQGELQASASSGLKTFYTGPTKPLALVSVQQPIQVFEQDSPKQVAAQQVLYEFQQTPTNAVSNVHVKQLFEPTEITTEGSLSSGLNNLGHQQQTSTNQYPSFSHPYASGYSPATSETIVSPVQHNQFTNHGQNTGTFSYYNPLQNQYQQSQYVPNSQKYTPGKYLYFNGKIVYQPNQVGQPQAQKQQGPNLAFLHNQQKVPMINFANRQPAQNYSATHAAVNSVPNVGVRPKMLPPPNLPPITYNRFQAPSEQQHQQINKPSAAPPQRQEEHEEEPENNEEESSENEYDENDEERSDDSEEDKEKYEEDDDGDDDHHRFKYYNFENDDDDHEDRYYRPKTRKHRYHYRDDDDEEDKDNQRGSSKYSSKSYPRSHKNVNGGKMAGTSEKFGWRENYSTSSEYKSPKEFKKSNKAKPKGEYRETKYTKKSGKPRGEAIEGRHSEHIPVTHKQKVYKERWYVTKDVGGKMEKRVENK
ncbi:probable serine/threonine-protein kinase fhkB [Cylas formicarius]|uniref:probable serine/threonine-protein kinase fhkB n=1 Tax=Cylas formicarius TaxID=197179 RepID=UPI002958CE2C|nr:probable serine/threonine-protein kinase fhkB [Cylas formicarius]